MIIVREAADNPSEMTFAEHYNVVEAFSAQRPSYSLHVRRLPGTARTGKEMAGAPHATKPYH